MASFTPQQIEEFLREFFDVVGTRQYVGARYVPLFGRPGEPSIEWDNSAPYEPLTIVTHQGDSYTSRQYVPAGIAIDNADYWAKTGNYNSQVEQYRQEVTALYSQWATYQEEGDQWREDTEAAFSQATEGYVNDRLAFAIKSGDTITIFSDSTFQRNPDPNTGITQKAVYEFMDELCDATIDNRGVGGTDTGWLYTLLSGYTTADLEGTDYIIVAYGTNDWQESLNPVRVATSTPVTSNLDTLYDAVLTRLETLAPKAHVLCVTPGFIHSTRANGFSSATSLLNQSANTVEAYADVIEKVAHEHNTACLRLDRVLGINNTNFASKMVPSGAAGSAWADIFVHYTEETNRRIACAILSGFWGCTATGDETPALNVTPWPQLLGMSHPGWNLRNDTYFNTNNQTMITTTTSTPFSISTGASVAGKTRYLAFYGNQVDVFVDNEQVAHKVTFGPCVLPIATDAADHLIRIQPIAAQVSSANISHFGIYIGRPNVYEIKPMNDMLYAEVKRSVAASTSDFWGTCTKSTFNNVEMYQLASQADVEITATGNRIECPAIVNLNATNFFGVAYVNNVVKTVFMRKAGSYLYFNDSQGTDPVVKNLNLAGMAVR